MKFFATSCFLLFVHLLTAWDPRRAFPNDDLSRLDDPIFQNLKIDLVETLKNSWCSEEKVHLLMDLTYLKEFECCVEIGAHSGASILPVAMVLRYLQNGHLHAIDAWSNAVATQHMQPEDPNRPWWRQVDMEKAYRLFLSRIEERGLASYCRVHRATSEAASDSIEEIDFLHLDGDYTEKGALQDLELFLPKVKSGGYILLSNLFIMVNGKAPKMRSYIQLSNDCEVIAEIDKGNAVLFQKG